MQGASALALTAAFRAAQAAAHSHMIYDNLESTVMFESQNQDDVQAFIESNSEARQLIGRHRELDRVVTEAELGVKPMDDLTLVTMKKEKLRAKDRLTYLWAHRSG
jgi:uncharacterized protein